MISCRALGVVTALTLTATATAASPAAAAPPTIEREVINETFDEVYLTAECGVPVTVTITGFRITREFERDRTGVQSVSTLNLTATAVAGDNTYRFKDVRTEAVRRRSNGDEVLSVSGQIPFGFNGVLKFDLATGETLHEPRERRDRQFAEACAALTA